MKTLVKNILVYVDGTEKSITAAQAAVCLARHFEAGLHAIFVVNLKMLDELLKAKIFLPDEELDYEKEIEYDGKKFLFSVSELAAQKNVTLKPVLAKGDVVEQVLACVSQNNIDLLVINELEEWPARKDYFSDIERIFRQSKCSVFVAKNKDAIFSMFDNLA